MSKVVIIGHGSYGTMMKSNLSMLVGEINGFYFVDFNIEDNLDILKSKLEDIIKEVDKEPILFACDLTGGSPFREASIISSKNQSYAVVGGLNTAGYSEIAYNLDLEPKALAQLGIEAAKASMLIYSID